MNHHGQHVRIKRIRHYALSEQEVALVREMLKQWRALPQPLDGELLRVTESLEAKLR